MSAIIKDLVRGCQGDGDAEVGGVQVAFFTCMEVGAGKELTWVRYLTLSNSLILLMDAITVICI